MNVNRELSFAEHLAKSVRPSTHPAVNRQIKDSKGQKQNRWDMLEDKCSPSEMSCENKWDMAGELTWRRYHQLGVIQWSHNAERLAKTVRPLVHPTIYRQIEDSNSYKQNRWDMSENKCSPSIKDELWKSARYARRVDVISKICQESWRHQLEVMNAMNVNRELGFAECLAKSEIIHASCNKQTNRR